jgi:hypothetical protein
MDADLERLRESGTDAQCYPTCHRNGSAHQHADRGSRSNHI